MKQEFKEKLHLVFLDENFTNKLFSKLEKLLIEDYQLDKSQQKISAYTSNTKNKIPIDEVIEMIMQAILNMNDHSGDTALALLYAIEGVSRANIATNKKLDTLIKTLNESVMNQEQFQSLQEKLDLVDDEVRKITKHDEILTWINNYMKRAEKKYDE